MSTTSAIWYPNAGTILAPRGRQIEYFLRALPTDKTGRTTRRKSAPDIHKIASTVGLDEVAVSSAITYWRRELSVNSGGFILTEDCRYFWSVDPFRIRKYTNGPTGMEMINASTKRLESGATVAMMLAANSSDYKDARSLLGDVQDVRNASA